MNKKISDAAKYLGRKARTAYDVLKPSDSLADTILFLPLLGDAMFYTAGKVIGGVLEPFGNELVAIEAAAPFAAIYVPKKVREYRIEKKQKLQSETFMNELIDELNKKGASIEKPAKYKKGEIKIIRRKFENPASENSCFSDGNIELRLFPKTKWDDAKIYFDFYLSGNTTAERKLNSIAKETLLHKEGSPFGIKLKDEHILGIGTLDYIKGVPKDTANALYNVVETYSNIRAKYKNEIDEISNLEDDTMNKLRKIQ